MRTTDTVRAMIEAYVAQDRDAAEALMADEFVFTSPQDDHVDRAAFFARCFPTAERLAWQRIVELVPASGDDVFVMYEYELRSGAATATSS